MVKNNDESLFSNIEYKVKTSYYELEKNYLSSGIKMPFTTFIIAVFVGAIVVGLIGYYLSIVFPNNESNPFTYAIIAFFSVLSLAVVIPLNMRDSRIRAVETNLPNALRHISIILKAGGTIESAIDEVARSNYGPLSDDLLKGLTQLQRGRPFEEMFMEVATDTGSKLFKRTAIIINDAKKSGAGLADAMNAIADDSREVNRLKRERLSRTTMQVVFIYASSLGISPMIFGFSLTIVGFIGAGIACAVPGAPASQLGFLNTVLVVFLAIEAIIGAMAVGVIQEGRFLRHVSRIPLMILISITVFEIGKRVGTFIIGNGGSC